MKHTLDKIESSVLAISSVLSILIALGDWLGLLDSLPWLSQRIPNLVLLSNGIILGCFAFVIYRRLVLLDKISSEFEKSTLQKTRDVVQQVDPNLRLVIGDYIEDLVDRIHRVVSENEFQVSDLSLFRFIYKKTLEVYVGSEFWATSVPSQTFFWKNQSTEQAISRFIKNKGKMKRIFFIESEEDFNRLEVRKILRIQCDIGVEVYTCLFNEIPRNLQKFFMVDTQGRIAWEPFRGPDNLIKGITITSNQAITSQYLKLFRQILALDSTTRFYDAISWIDPNLAIILTEVKHMTTPTNDPNAFRQFEYSGWQQSVEQYDAFFGSLTSQVIDPLLDSVHAGVDMKILDIASGPGYVASRAFQRGCKVVGIDFSDAMVAKARATYPDIEFWQGEAEALPFNESEFEGAVMNFGLLHLAQPEEALRQAFRVIRSKAKFGFTVWTKPEESVAFKIVLRAIETYGDSNVALPVGPPFFRYSDPEQCISALKNAGFSNPTVKIVSMLWELADYNELFDAFYRGTARTGGLLRAQTNQAIEDIRAAVRDSVSIYIKNNKLALPMSSVLASAQKP